MADLDDEFLSRKWAINQRNDLQNNLVVGNDASDSKGGNTSQSIGAGFGGLAAVVGAEILVGIGVAGAAVPLLALGIGYLVYKKTKGFPRYGLRKAIDKMNSSDTDSDS